jgi:hypothetical protein
MPFCTAYFGFHKMSSIRTPDRRGSLRAAVAALDEKTYGFAGAAKVANLPNLLVGLRRRIRNGLELGA